MTTTVVVDHPLAAERLTQLRDENTPRPIFRLALHELSRMLIYEATRALPVDSPSITTPMGPATGTAIAEQPVLVPVLRAGLGMLGAALELLPNAPVGFIGAKRNEETLQPDPYVNTLPAPMDGAAALVLDPMLATGGSLIHTATMLRDAGAGTITTVAVLAAPEGIDAFRQGGFDGPIVTASVDERLNDVGFILPGLGDAGDRQFGV